MCTCTAPGLAGCLSTGARGTASSLEHRSSQRASGSRAPVSTRLCARVWPRCTCAVTAARAARRLSRAGAPPCRMSSCSVGDPACTIGSNCSASGPGPLTLPAPRADRPTRGTAATPTATVSSSRASRSRRPPCAPRRRRRRSRGLSVSRPRRPTRTRRWSMTRAWPSRAPRGLRRWTSSCSCRARPSTPGRRGGRAPSRTTTSATIRRCPTCPRARWPPAWIFPPCLAAGPRRSPPTCGRPWTWRPPTASGSPPPRRPWTSDAGRATRSRCPNPRAPSTSLGCCVRLSSAGRCVLRSSSTATLGRPRPAWRKRPATLTPGATSPRPTARRPRASQRRTLSGRHRAPWAVARGRG